MKQLFFLIVTLALFSCKKTGSTDPIPASLEGKWRMIAVQENVSGLVSIKPPSTTGNVEITFVYAGFTKGTFTGNTPANQLGQNEFLTDLNQSMTISSLIMTKVAEITWGKEFVDNVCNAQEYSFGADGLLNIKTTHKILTFKKL